jgi:hypothetical protein
MHSGYAGGLRPPAQRIMRQSGRVAKMVASRPGSMRRVLQVGPLTAAARAAAPVIFFPVAAPWCPATAMDTGIFINHCN